MSCAASASRNPSTTAIGASWSGVAEVIDALIPERPREVDALSRVAWLVRIVGELPRVLGDVLHLVEGPAAGDLLRGARIGRRSISLRAAPPGEVVVREALVVRVDLGLTHVADAVVPGPARRDVVEVLA